MANSDKNILITPNTGSTTANPTIRFTGADNIPITLRTLDNGTVSFEGTAGQLFSISNGLAGTIFSVNDISGIPSLEILDTGLVKLNQYNGQTAIGASTAAGSARLSVYPSASANVGLTVKGVSSQSGNLQEWQDSAGNILSRITSAGSILIGQGGSGWSAPNGSVISIANSAGVIPITARGAASQTANLTEWQNSSSTVMSYIRSDGGLYVTAASDNRLYNLGIGGSSNGISWLYVTTPGATQKPVVIRGASSQTASLTEWQNSSGTIIAGLAANGAAFFGSTGAANASITTIPTASTVLGIIIRGVASQSANLTEWQDSSATVLGSIDPDGKAYFSYSSTNTSAFGVEGNLRLRNRSATSNNYSLIEAESSGGGISSGIQFITSDHTNSYGKMIFGTRSAAGFNGTAFTIESGGGITTTLNTASAIGLIVKGASSQTGDLQQWQDSSGTVFTRIANAGQFYSSAAMVLGTTFLSSTLSVQTRSASEAGIVVRGSASQSASLQEWQNSTPLAVAAISASGSLSLKPIAYASNQGGGISFQDTSASWTAGGIYARSNGSGTPRIAIVPVGLNQELISLVSSGYVGLNTVAPQATFHVTPLNTASVGLLVKGVSSQSGNLTEWQDSSAGVLGKVDKDGKATFAGLTLTGDLTVGGTTTTVNATTLNVADPMIYMGGGNTGNSVDLGIVSSFNDGTYQHSGFVRDASDGKWKLFKGVTDEPTTTVNFTQGSLDALAVGVFEATSATIGNVSNTELQYLDGVTSAIQTQINSKLSTTAAASTYQPLDADLTAIAALTGTSGFLKTNGSGTWSVEATAGSSGGYVFQSLIPTSAAAGDRWIDSDTGIEYTYVDDGVGSGQWVELSTSGFAGIQGIQGEQGIQGIQGATGATGATGDTGPTGPQGDKGGIDYTFSTTTTMADPGTGTIRFNNSTIGSVTQIAVDDLTSESADVSAYILSFDDSTSTVKGHLVIKSNTNNDSTYCIFQINSLVDNTGWTQLNVTYISGTTPTNAENIVLNFSRTGDKGEQGIQGIQGEPGSGGGVLATKITQYTSGSGTFTRDANTLFAEIYVTGGGGGGGGCDSDGSSASASGGGGAGGTAVAYYTPTQLGSTAAYSVGSAGSAGSTAGGNGGTGGNSTFTPSGTGSVLTGNGGAGGIGTGSGYGNYYSTFNGGEGGTASGGNWSYIGLDGLPGFGVSPGGSPSTSTASTMAGNGAASYWGGGASGPTRNASSGSNAGVNATHDGAGGSGGVNNNNTSGVLGGTGAAGIIIIVEYLSA